MSSLIAEVEFSRAGTQAQATLSHILGHLQTSHPLGQTHEGTRGQRPALVLSSHWLACTRRDRHLRLSRKYALCGIFSSQPTKLPPSLLGVREAVVRDGQVSFHGCPAHTVTGPVPPGNKSCFSANSLMSLCSSAAACSDWECGRSLCPGHCGWLPQFLSL